MAKVSTKITTRDKKLLLSFLGIACFVLSFSLIYRPYSEKNEMLKQENEQKQQEVARLAGLKEKEEYFKTETETMKIESDKIVEEFPSKTLEEDGILVVRDMETEVDVEIDSINLGNQEFVYSPDGTAVVEEEEDSQTLAEKSGEATQNAINEIEGVEESEEQSQTVVYKGGGRALYRNQNTIQFKTDYQGIKDMFAFLANQKERMTVDTINLTYDNTTGLLSGDMNMNFFSMISEETSYEPRDPGEITLGTENIFATMSKKSTKSSKDTKTEKKTNNIRKTSTKKNTTKANRS